MTPIVSVVVPAFNNSRFIEQTIDSILAQTLTDLELVVADHSSTDDTWQRLQKYATDPRVTLVVTPAGGGAPANWSRVTALASGTYIKLVCGDDLIDPECLAEQVAIMDAHPGVVLTSCRRDLIDADGKTVTRSRGLAGLGGVVPGRKAARRAVRVGSNLFGEPACNLFRREALERIGGWASTEPFVIDQQTFCNLLMTGDFHALPKALARFRLSASQWSVQLARQQSDQVVAFHHRLAAENPGLLSRSDLLVGDSRARAMAYVRRLAYIWLGRKLTPTPEPSLPAR
jgi:glycosyltransferase involved in cell wall biosynthesis